MRNTYIPNYFEKNTPQKLNNYNNYISKYSSFHTKVERKGKNKNFITLNYTNYRNKKLPYNINTNKSINKYKSSYNTNFSKYVNINLMQTENTNSLNSSNKNSIESYNSKEVNNHTFIDDINLLKMKLNFRVLEHKLASLSHIVLPNDTKANYSVLSKNKTFENNNYKYDYNTKSFDSYKNINSLRNNLSSSKMNRENTKQNYNIKNFILNNNINIDKYNYEKNSLKLEDEYDKEENKKPEVNVIDTEELKEDKTNIFDPKLMNDEELKNLTDNKINGNKLYTKEINDNFENKNHITNSNEKSKNIINNGKKNNNNNFIISNISGEINYIPPEKIILEKKFKKLNKINENLKIVNNTFSINSVKSEKEEKEKEKKEKEEEKEKVKEDEKEKTKINEEEFIKSISINLLEEENQKRSESFNSSDSNEIGKKIEKKNSPIKRKKSEDCKENNNNNINLPIDYSMEEIDENKNTNKNDLNFNKNFEKDDDIIINMNPISDNSRNRNIILLEDENEINNKKISNTYNSEINNDYINKKKVLLEDDIILISYNDMDKPTNLKVYKVVDKKKWLGIEINFKPKITKNYINNLKSNKLINSILIDKNTINKDKHKLISFSNKTTKTKKISKNLNKNSNIINKNIKFIKQIEKKLKNQSLDKNKDNSHKKDKKSNKINIKDDTKENTLKNGIILNKKLLDSIKRNNTEKKIVNNYLCADAIQEEEEGYEESKVEKKELNHD